MTYFEQRMKALGIAAPYTTTFIDPNQKERTSTFFSENEQGDILIHYFKLDGMPYLYRTDTAKYPHAFVRRRLKRPVGKNKYSSPKGQGMLPYFPESVIRKYMSGLAIDTLFLIEGEFKAFKASMEGMDCVGMGSIHGFYGQGSEVDGAKRLHPDIIKLLERCQVKKLCLLLDADTLVINYEPKKDLWKRQNSFFAAVINFYKVSSFTLSQDRYAMEAIYFGHIHEKFKEDYKGMDDLLIGMSEKKKNVTDEALLLDEGSMQYFNIKKLGPNYYTEMQKYFAVESVDVFFKQYQKYIGPYEFVYRNAIYVQDGDTDKVRFIFHKDVEKFFRLGKDWMTVVQVPNERGLMEEEIKSFNVSEITRDYPPKRFPGFMDKVARYDAYCNIPDWNPGSYKRVHENCYNITNPITHPIEAGDFPTTIAFLKHLFSGAGSVKVKEEGGVYSEPIFSDDKQSLTLDYDLGNGLIITETQTMYDQFTVALDWLTIFHQQPTHRLPVPILVSKEFGTGKSTFLFWLQWIYGTNVAVLNNEQFKMPFNSHYITKNIIGLDEGFLDVDKKQEKERLKQLVTAKKQYLQYKGVDMQAFNYFGKVVICSNDADDVMKMEDAENRWFVVKVPPLVGKGDPDFDDKLQSEIPAWLNFLSKRKIAHPRKTRLWFEEKAFITEQFLEIVKNTKTRVEKNIDELMREMFLMYKVERLDLPRKWIVDELNKQSKYKIDQQEVKRYMDDKLGYILHPPARIKIPSGWMDIAGTYEVRYEESLQRHYRINVLEWINEEEANERKESHEKEAISTDTIDAALGIPSDTRTLW
jgi:hypothetical protein